MSDKLYDIVSMGRSSIDLYANEIGVPFTEIKSFSSFVGGCPTNIAVGTKRLGLKSVLLTAVGDDPVGEFVVNFLNKEGVETKFIPSKKGFRTSAVLLGIQPPDKFPLVFYRENCADIQLNIDDVVSSPIAHARVLLVSGTGLSKEPSRSATLKAVEIARAAGTKVFLDLDFRADQWTSSAAADVRAYGVCIRALLHHVDVALGTEEEIKAAILQDASDLTVTHSQVSAPEIKGDVEAAIAKLVSMGPEALVVKRGASGSTVHLKDGKVFSAKPFKVEVCNVLGAGDAFASGFIYGYLKGWDWQKAARMGNATGAIVVTRHGCANFMPYENEALEFVTANGGFASDDSQATKGKAQSDKEGVACLP